jgi:hypothetical protein
MLAVGLLVLAAAWSCSGGDSKKPNTVKATGTVKFEGKPVEGATVTLAPEGQGRAAFGKTDAQGRCRFATTSSIEGVMPGTYQVGITKERTEGAMTSEESQKYYEKTGQPPPAPKVINELPEKYRNPASSEFKVTVKADGTNDFPFDLKK